MVAASGTQVHPRVRKRIPCELAVGGDRHRGLVLNVSRGGLYVQTHAEAQVGSLVGVDLAPPAWRSPIGDKRS